jgi:hypothetical protein
LHDVILPHRAPPAPFSPFSKAGGRRRPVEEEDDEEDDGESDSEVHGALLAARQINGDSEAEDDDSVFDGGGGQDDDDDSNDDGGGGGCLGAEGGDVAAAAAEGGGDARRSVRAGRFQGPMVEVNVNRFAARPTPRTKRPRPSKRLRDRVRNRAHYAAKTAAARVEFLWETTTTTEHCPRWRWPLLPLSCGLWSCGPVP